MIFTKPRFRYPIIQRCVFYEEIYDIDFDVSPIDGRREIWREQIWGIGDLAAEALASSLPQSRLKILELSETGLLEKGGNS